MKKKIVQIQDRLHDDEYHALADFVTKHFIESAHSLLFTTSVTKEQLVQAYLSGLPENVRQYYTCSACFSFFGHYGTLGVIDNNGKLRSAMWDFSAEGWFADSIANMNKLFAKATVTGVFITNQSTLGSPEAGGWSHFHLRVPARLLTNHARLTSGQIMAEKTQDFTILSTYLAQYDIATIKAAVALCKSETMYRSEKVLGVAEWFLVLKETTLRKTNKANIIWKAVASAPAGWCHIGSSMIGTLLDDIALGMPMNVVSERFAAKMNPTQYQRAQVAPSAGNRAVAEKIVAQMKVEGSLRRRHALLAEVPLLWIPPHKTKQPKQKGVFSNVPVKQATTENAPAIPGKVITWEKFRKDILPRASSLEVFVPADTDRMSALVTAVDPGAPYLFQWDNPLSWHYANGIDAEIKKRVSRAGGQVENVDIRASLMWENRNDLDLHIVDPLGDHIYYSTHCKRNGHRPSQSGGYLDVDMNVHGDTTKPVENIRWESGDAPMGHYRVFVQNYRFHESSYHETPYFVTVEIFGAVFAFQGVIPQHLYGEGSNQKVFEFDLQQHGIHNVVFGIPSYSERALNWIPVGDFHTCVGITSSPNMWNTDRPLPQHGNHTFFILENCVPPEEVGQNFFVETLKSEYREIRSTLDAWNNMTPLEENPEGQLAAGLGFVQGQPWNVHVRVNSGGFETIYKIDRWD